MSDPLEQYTAYQSHRFLEGCAELSQRMSSTGYRGMFQHEINCANGKVVYGLWVNLKTGALKLTITNRLGVTDYYDVTETK